MAIIDYKLLFADKVDIHTAAQLAALDPVDLEAAYDAGKGTPLVVEITITEAFTLCTSYSFTLTSATTSGGTYTEVARTKAIPLADLTVGKVVRLPVPEGISQFLKLSSVTVGTACDAGQGTARLVPAA